MRFVHPTHVKIITRADGSEQHTFTDGDGSQIVIELTGALKVTREREPAPAVTGPTTLIPPGGSGTPGVLPH